MPMSYAEPLRIVGQWLDAQGAEGLELTATTAGLVVRWFPAVNGRDARAFTWAELARIHEQASRQRQQPFGQPRNEWAGALRALGQELDILQVEQPVIRTERDGLQVSGIHGDTPLREWYPLTRLQEMDRLRRSGPTPV
jgi:hypothetical protein